MALGRKNYVNSMGDFLGKNRIFLAIIVAAFIIGGFIYLSSRSPAPFPQEAQILQEQPQQKQPAKEGNIIRHSEEEQIYNPELINQIMEIEQILSESSDIRVACLVVGAGNYIEKYGTEEEMGSLSKDYEQTKNKCFQYRIVYSRIVNLIAEPELAYVKGQLSHVGDVLRAFGVYVILDKGLDGKVIDAHEKDLEKFITQTREEILKVKRQYNLEM